MLDVELDVVTFGALLHGIPRSLCFSQAANFLFVKDFIIVIVIVSSLGTKELMPHANHRAWYS